MHFQHEKSHLVHYGESGVAEKYPSIQLQLFEVSKSRWAVALHEVQVLALEVQVKQVALQAEQVVNPITKKYPCLQTQAALSSSLLSEALQVEQLFPFVQVSQLFMQGEQMAVAPLS